MFKVDYIPFMKGQISFELLCKHLCGRFDVPVMKNTVAEINRAFHLGKEPLYTTTQRAMKLLKKAGIQNGVLSNTLPNLNDTVKPSSLIAAKHIFTSFDLHLLKPDPRIYETVRQKLGCRFYEIIFVDDKKS